ncbi:MAG: SDR family oxidoreductase [Novosphingobium sp.]|nr:SDR family oxidoreductase [Novosphingobium sp.]
MTNDAFLLTGKVAIITGSSRGIGFATARALGLAGAKVMLMSRKPDSCEAAANALRQDGIESAWVAGHAAREDDIRRAVDTALAQFGRLDFLVANAAINPTFDPLVDLAEESFQKVMDTNVAGPLRLARHGLPRLAEGGAMVVVSSVNAASGFRSGSSYGMSKAAVEAMTRQLAVEWGEKGVRINAVRPGATRTDMVRKLVEQDGYMENVMQTTPLRRIAEPEDVANVIVFLLSNAARHMTGQVLTIDGGQSILRGPA